MGRLLRLPSRFRRWREVDPYSIPPERCSGILHVFAEVPGYCQCRAEYWGADGVLHSGDEDAIGIHHVA